MRPLVILRPEPAASRTAGQARDMGLTVHVLPLFELVPLPWSAPDPAGFDGLVLTSANAVCLGGEQLGKLSLLPVHAVGAATAAAARAAGLTVVAVGEGGVRNMDLPAGRLLHLAGRDHCRWSSMTISVYEARRSHNAGIDDCGPASSPSSPRAGAGSPNSPATPRLSAPPSVRAAAAARRDGSVHSARQPTDGRAGPRPACAKDCP